MGKNVRLSAPASAAGSPGNFYSLVSGEKLENQRAPARVAWEIECLAASRGWPVGETLGSEMALRQELQVSRETLREAIRIVESRGAIRMRRGRAGGLTLLCPPIERIAASLATYLRAIGITREQFEQSVRGLDQLLAWQLARNNRPAPIQVPGESARHWLARASGRQTYLIYIAVLDELAPPAGADQPVPGAVRDAVATRNAAEIFRLLGTVPFVSSHKPADAVDADRPVRASAVAAALVKAAGHSGLLGNEASLCEQLDLSRPIFRQALRVLQDLDLILVRLGRGGGYELKKPSPIGIIRQLFVWLAARNCDPFSLNELMWDLNAANVRLAGEKLAAASASERTAACDRIESAIEQSCGPARFVHLQQSLAEIADCPIVDTLARCIVSYQARSYGDLPELPESAALEWMDLAVVAALRAGDLDLAERTLRTRQDQAEELIMESFGLRAAAE